MLRGQRNPLAGLIDSAARLPWWGGIVLAFLAFMMLHPFAIMEVPASGPVDEGAVLTSKAFWRGLADTVQYVVPAMLIVAPGIAALVMRFMKGPDA